MVTPSSQGLDLAGLFTHREGVIVIGPSQLLPSLSEAKPAGLVSMPDSLEIRRAQAGPSSFPLRSGFVQIQVRETRSSSSLKRSERGQEVLAARPVGYPWPEQIARKMYRNVEKTRSSSSQKRSEPAALRGQAADEHGGSPWFQGGVEPGRAPAGEGRKPVAGRVRRACDDAPLSVPVRLCDALYLLAPGKRGLPPTFPWHLFSRPHTPRPCRRPEIGFVFPARFRLYWF